jgi:hypothetical protein
MNKPVHTAIAKIGNQYVAMFVRDEFAYGTMSQKVLETKFFATDAEAQAWGSEMYNKFDTKSLFVIED